MYYLFLFLFVSIVSPIYSNPDHLKPFGTIGNLLNIEEIEGEYPDLLKFFTYYVSKSEPILSRQVLINNLHYNIWKSDEALENNVDDLSKTPINVESFNPYKRIQMKFSDFIDKYQKEHFILADHLPEILRKYIIVPSIFQSEQGLSTLQSVTMVMNDVNTSPLIFNDEYDLYLCLYRGNKRVVLVNTNKYSDIRQLFTSRNRPAINPESVDLNQFPAFANIDYYVANLTSGDCLFIPNSWIYQERSLDSTISMIYNIQHQQALNVDLNTLENSKYDSSLTLDQIEWSNLENEQQNLREVMMNLVNSKSNNFEKWLQTFSKHFSFDLSSDPETSSIFVEFYDIIDVNGDGEISSTEIEQIDGMHQYHISDILYEMFKLINDKQQSKNTSEQVKEANENENEEVDEQLHIQNYKTDL